MQPVHAVPVEPLPGAPAVVEGQAQEGQHGRIDLVFVEILTALPLTIYRSTAWELQASSESYRDIPFAMLCSRHGKGYEMIDAGGRGAVCFANLRLRHPTFAAPRSNLHYADFPAIRCGCESLDDTGAADGTLGGKWSFVAGASQE